jgi:hypothetical protein
MHTTSIYPEDGGGMLIQNVSKYLQDYTTSHHFPDDSIKILFCCPAYV